MKSVGETLPQWLETDEPLNSIMKKYPGLKQLKEKDPVEFKKALGIDTIESPYAKRKRLMKQRDES